MTLTRKLASALCLAFLFITLSSNAQVDSATGNLINYGTTPTDTTSTWNNGVYVNQLCFQYGQPGNCGPNPSIRAASGSINFSYGTADLNQVVNINKALAASGSGVQLSGFNFSFTAKNGNGWDDGRQDYLAAYVKLYGSAGNQVANYDYSSQTNQRYGWTNFNFNETFANPQLASLYSTARVGFVGRDNNYWAGNYGPEIFNVSFALKYRVDPCAQNAAYGPNCAGFNNIVESTNVLNSNIWSQSMYQAAAINTALQNGGIGAQVHGMRYSFDWAVGGQGCTDTFLWWCVGWGDSNIGISAKMTAANGQVLINKDYVFSGQNVSGRVEDKLLLPSTLNQTALGNVSMQSWGWGDSYAGNFKTSLIYTPDPCVSNPLYSTTCSGYAVAYAKNMLLGSTVASASAPAVAAPSPAPAEAAPALAEASPALASPAAAQAAPAQSSPAPAPAQDANQNPSVASADPAQPSPTQPGPATTTPQPAGGPPQTTTASASSSSSSGPSGGSSAGPSKLAMSVVKTAQANDKATQAAAVQNAAKTLENAQQSSQASSNMAITMNQDMSANSAVAAANFSSQTTQASQQTTVQANQPQQTAQTSTQTQQSNRQGPQVQQQQQDTQQAQVQSTSIVQYQAPQQQEQQQTQSQTSTSVVRLMPPQQQEQQQTQSQMTAGMITSSQSTYTQPQQQPQDTQSTQVSMLKPPAQPVVEVQQQTNTGTGLTVTRNLFAYNPLTSFSNANTSITTQQQPMYQPRLDTRQSEVEAPQMQIASFTGSRAGNPLSEIMMQQQFEMMQNNIAQPASSVNRNVQPNELAGGVDIASMATTPTGFNAYSFVLKDAAFYEPKEVYKNQRTVDNEQVLRGLTRGSDAKHQQMIDQQYKLGN